MLFLFVIQVHATVSHANFFINPYHAFAVSCWTDLFLTNDPSSSLTSYPLFDQDLFQHLFEAYPEP